MKKSYLLCAVAALGLASCGNKETVGNQASLVESSNVKRIILESGTVMYSPNMNFYVDSNDVAHLSVMYSGNENYIDFYNLDSCKFSKKINIDVLKNNIPTYFIGHSISTTGDLYVVNASPAIVNKLDESGNVVSSFDLTNIDGVALTYLMIPFPTEYRRSLIFDNGKMICPLEYRPYTLGPDVNALDVPLALVYDTVTMTRQRTALTFPESIKDDGLYSMASDGKRYVYSFESLSDLYVTTDFQSFSTINGKSDCVGEVVNEIFSNPNASENEFANFNYTKSAYGSIFYDRYKDVFYRFCYAKCKESDSIGFMNMDEYNFCKGDFSIMIFNNNLEVIGETKFKAGNYAPKMCFVDKNGLWLSENNVDKPDNSEDVLVFRCIDLKYN